MNQYRPLLLCHPPVIGISDAWHSTSRIASCWLFVIHTCLSSSRSLPPSLPLSLPPSLLRPFLSLPLSSLRFTRETAPNPHANRMLMKTHSLMLRLSETHISSKCLVFFRSFRTNASSNAAPKLALQTFVIVRIYSLDAARHSPSADLLIWIQTFVRIPYREHHCRISLDSTTIGVQLYALFKNITTLILQVCGIMILLCMLDSD